MTLFFDETWFYAPVSDGAESAVLPDDELHHALKVLRLRIGAEVVVTNGEGSVYRATLQDEKGLLEIGGRIQHEPLPMPLIPCTGSIGLRTSGVSCLFIVRGLSERGVSAPDICIPWLLR